MKSVKKIQETLIHELCGALDNVVFDVSLDYYNEPMGDTSFILAGYLQLLLREKFSDWSNEKWIDDSLLTKVELVGNKLSIWGVMIWGVENQTCQWTDPFYFEIVLNECCTSFIELKILFGDIDRLELRYSEFCLDRAFWDKNYYSSSSWNPYERNWKYIICLTSADIDLAN